MRIQVDLLELQNSFTQRDYVLFTHLSSGVEIQVN